MKNILIPVLLFLSYFQINAASLSAIIVTNQVLTINSVGAQDYEVSANAELHISIPDIAATGIINITNESGWVFLDGVLPTNAISLYLSKIRVNGQQAINKTNIRVTNYLRGCVIMPHGLIYQPLTVYKDDNYSGEQLKLSQYSYYRKVQLGTFDDAISSFKLKKGYMATFAMNEDGTRFSKVYIADNADVTIPVLPAGLNNQVSFIRVFPWRYAGKKGIGYGSIAAPQILNCDWYYSWGPKSIDDLTNFEFVPMKWNGNTVNDANWSDILIHQNVTHVLGFNEPDGAEQANMSVDKQIELWPKMLESGLRVGAPAVAGNLTQLYEFIDRCDALNYRVDFIPIHLYFETTAQNFYNKCKAVYDRTKRPIWITEFNYGGDWTSGKPTDAVVATKIAEIIQKFDTARIIERYAVFDFHNETNPYRYVFALPKSNYITTPMGSMYRDNNAPMAFRSALEVSKPYKLIPPTNIKAVSEGAKTVYLTWVNDGETQSVTIERAPKGTTTFTVLATLQGNAVSYTDKVPYTGTFNYRIKTLTTTNQISPYGTVQIDIVEIYNVALNKNASASSILSGYPPNLAIDGDTASAASRWVNVRDVFPCDMTVGLKGKYLINEVKLYTGYTGYNTPLTSFNFQYWDGSGWVNLVTETANTNPRYSKKFITVETDSVRLLVNAVADGIVRLYEMQVMGAISINTSVNPATATSDLIFSPNPSNGIISVLNFTNATRFEVYDLQGKCIYKNHLSDKINLSFLSKGMYLIRTDLNETTKIVIN
jgi:hypothetical protein